MVKFILKKISGGFFYTFGRILLYLVLGAIIYFMISKSNINPEELSRYVM